MRRFFVGLAITAMLGIIPSQARGNDREISQAIVKSLQVEQQDNKLRGFDIDLEVDHGDVYLKGTVASEEQEKLALDIARRADGVRQVYNELEIDETAASKSSAPSRTTGKVPGLLSSLRRASTGSSRRQDPPETKTAERTVEDSTTATSTDLAERIIARLKEEKASGNLRGFSIEVEVEDGIAWLNGKVASADQQRRVLEMVRNIAGVRQVVNGMTITQPKGESSKDLAQEIVSILKEKKDRGILKDFSVDVEVDNGIVWLKGVAANRSQQQIILDAARYLPGVTKVVNDLTIGGSNPRKAQQVGASSEIPSARPAIPQPLPIDDGPVGSAVSNDQPSRSANSGRGTVQYVWVPANQAANTSSQTPLAFAPARSASHMDGGDIQSDQPVPINASVPGTGIAPARFDHPQLPQYAWPSYAPYPNYGAVTYPKQYSPMAWPYIGPFYPYPQVPLGWRKVELKWKDGWWQLDFKDRH